MGNVTVLSKKDNTRNLGFGVKLDAPVVAPLTKDLVFVKSSRVGEFTRTTDGTFVDHNDNIVTAGTDIARFEGSRFINDSKGCSEYVGENAIEFDETVDNYIQTINGLLEVNAVSFWAKPTAEGEEALMLVGSPSSTNSFGIRGAGYWSAYDGSWSVTAATVLWNEWQHVMYIYNTNGYDVYLNGEFKTRTSDSKLQIDRITYNSSNAFNGNVDNVIWWDNNAALTGEEVMQQYLYNKKGSDYLVAPENVVGAWKLDDTSSTIVDYSGNGNNGTFYSGGVPATPTLIEGVYSSDTKISNDVLKGILVEGQATNLFLNSTAPVTQDITVVSGTTYTISCKGTGSITLSGAGTGTVEDGTPVTITASTTTLTCTISGDLDYAQVEASDFDSSFIITEGTAVTRTKDVLKYETSDLSTNNFSMRLDYTPINDGVNGMYLYDSEIDSDNSTSIYYDGSDLIFNKRRNGFDNTSKVSYSFTEGVTSKIGITNSITTGFRLYVDGTEGDLTFSGNDGTVSGSGVTISDGAMVFDGSTGYVEGEITLADEFSISMWVDFNDLSVDKQLYSSFFGNSYYKGYGLSQRNNNRIYLAVRQDLDGSNSLTSNLFITKDLYHIIGTYDGTTMKLYINSVLDNTKTYSAGLSSNTGIYRIGQLTGGGLLGSWNSTATKYSTSIYNRALTPTEVTQIYQAGKDAISPIRDGLVAELSGREFAGTESNPTTIYDTSNKYGDLQFGTYQYIGSDSDGNNQAQGNYKNLKQYDKTISKTSMEDRTQ